MSLNSFFSVGSNFALSLVGGGVDPVNRKRMYAGINMDGWDVMLDDSEAQR